MRREEKNVIINSLADQLKEFPHFYLADISGLNAEDTAAIRRQCFEKEIKLIVVKNTLLRKALEQIEFQGTELFDVLKGSTSIMLTAQNNVPAKLIKEFSKKNKLKKPVLKGAFVEDTTYIGEATLEELVNIKSKEELIGDIIGLLQSPAKNVISALQSGGNILSGVVKTLSEREE
ncbi:50S ribosomal protein L10 [Alistipes sp. ZOR0009]|jgi:large subunit ribosomal protein L10|uniref:50S ribosomal protein L10 n=1 Tax=Alistipes sp. ZOR0009 TaxID=1339253 RepID=UPI000647FBEA|nr:50S ribosomal protein L10 [Alistipes sp. ZOR0009]